MTTALDWLGFTVTFAALVVVGARVSRGTQDYLVAGRRVGFFALVATLVMTEFNTSMLLAFSKFGYLVGPMAVGLPAVFLVGLGWYTISVARQWKR